MGELELGFRRFQGKVAGDHGNQREVDGDHPRRGWLPGPSPGVRRGESRDAVRRRRGAPCDWGVVEVSSLPARVDRKFPARVAALLNLTEDHRDRYAAKEAYFEAKMAVFRNQGPSDTAVVNADDPG